MQAFLRAGLAGLLALAALAPAPAAAAPADPSVEEMIEALSVKPEAMRTRSIRYAPSKKPQGQLQLAVQFDFGSATVSPASREVLGRLASAMKSGTLESLHYRIEGHTDAVGDPVANLRLSERRAEAVRQFLLSASGVAPARLAAAGMGSAKPADAADPRAAVNRRVVIVSMEAPAPAAAAAASATATPDGAGTVEHLKGELQMRRGSQATALQVGARVREGDVLSTAPGATALVRLDDGANLLLRAGTVLRVAKLRLSGDPSRWSQGFNLVVGAFRYVTGALGAARPEAVAFNTHTATVGIRGTDIDVVHTEEGAGADEAGTYVKVNKGAVALGGVDGTRVDLAKDEQAFAGPKRPLTRGAAPVPAAVRLKGPAGVFRKGDLDDLLEGG